VRRFARWIMTTTEGLLAVASTLIVLAWLLATILTDRWLWSQYLWWIPTPAWGAGAILALATWWALVAIKGRRDPSSPASSRLRSLLRPRPILGAITALLLLHAGLVQYRLYRFVLPVREPGVVRIANWNPAVPVESLHGPIAEQDADLIAIVNQPGGRDVDELAASLGPDWRAVRSDRLSVLTRLPLRRWGSMRLGLEGRVMRSYHFKDLDVRMAEQVDEGRALFVETVVDDEPFVVWVVDIPSDVRLARAGVMAHAAATIRSFQGRIFAYDAEGERLVERLEGGFPEAHVILGDFNTPRGSRSLSRLVGDRRNAFDEAGRGWTGTFPRTTPLFQIDLMFVGHGWRTTAYRIFDPADGWHLAQVGDVAPNPK